MHGRESENDAAGTERGSAYNVDVHGASGAAKSVRAGEEHYGGRFE